MRFIIGVLILLFGVSFVLAESIDVTKNVSCEDISGQISEQLTGKEIPRGIPFSNEILELNFDSEFFVYLKIKENQVAGFYCNESKEVVTYFVNLNSSLFKVDMNEVESPVDFYNEKRASGEIEIKANGFTKKFKLGILNFGAKILGWFI